MGDEHDDWTGAWIVVDREGSVVEGSSAEFRAVDDWLTPSAIAAFWTCFELAWAGLSDVSFATRDRRVVRFAAETEPRGWRLTCFEHTVHARISEAEVQVDRIHVLTDFAGAIARELVDPMSIVQAKIELMIDLDIADPGSIRRHLGIALQHAERVSHVLDNLRKISQPQRLASERWAVSALVEKVLDQLGTTIRSRVQLQVESALYATGPLAIASRVVASLVRGALQRRSEIWLVARTHRGRPTILVGPSAQRRGPSVPLRPAITSHQPLVLHLGATLEAFSDGEEEWVELSLPRPAPHRPRRPSQSVQLFALGSPTFQGEAARHLGPHGLVCTGGTDRREAVSALKTGRIDVALFDVELPAPGPRGHALAHDLAARYPDVAFFVAVRAPTRPLPLGSVHFVRWPDDAPEIVRAVRTEG